MGIKDFIYLNKEGAVLGLFWGIFSVIFSHFTENQWLKWTIYLPSSISSQILGLLTGDKELLANPMYSLVTVLLVGITLGIIIDAIWRKNK